MSCRTSHMTCLPNKSSGDYRCLCVDAMRAVYLQFFGPTWAQSSCPFTGRLRFPSCVSVDQAALLALVSRFFLVYTWHDTQSIMGSQQQDWGKECFVMSCAEAGAGRR